VGGLIALAVSDRKLASRFDEVEQSLAALFPDQLADELAQAVHVLAQRPVLLREKDVGADGA
ncbi:MAG TPA: hypothetical protein VIQ99_07440, partial [Gammaproteobacteria bacterium]